MARFIVVDIVSSPEAISIVLSSRKPFFFHVSIPVAHRYALEIGDADFLFQEN